MKHTIAILLLMAAAGAIPAQQRPNGSPAKTPPVRLQRTPPARAVAPEGVPSPDKYPFDRLINTLESDSPPPSPAPGGAVPGLPPGSPVSEVPKDFNPAKDVPLPATAKEALSVGQAWMTENVTPAPGKDGRVLYTYGAGLPTLVCAPLRVCVVELEEGEKTRRRAADRRFGPLDHFTGNLRQWRFHHPDDRGQTQTGRPRYRPPRHHGPAGVLPPPHFETGGLSGADRLRIPGERGGEVEGPTRASKSSAEKRMPKRRSRPSTRSTTSISTTASWVATKT